MSTQAQRVAIRCKVRGYRQQAMSRAALILRKLGWRVYRFDKNTHKAWRISGRKVRPQILTTAQLEALSLSEQARPKKP